MTTTNTDPAAQALITLTLLATQKAGYVLGGSDNFEHGHYAQIAEAMRVSETTQEGWDQLCAAAMTEAEKLRDQAVIEAEKAAIERRRESRRPQ